MRILFILELFYPNVGGNERLFLTLGEELVTAGHKVKVITTKHSPDLPSKEVYHGIEIIRLGFRNRFAFTFFSIPAIIHHIRGTDIVHTTSYNAAFPAWISSFLCRKKCMITFHEVWGKLWFRLPFLRWYERILFYVYEWFILRLGFYLFVGVSDFTRMSLINAGVKEKKVIRIYNGLKEEEYQQQRSNKPDPAKFTFTFFGRPGHSKGLDILMEASEKFLEEDKRELKLILSKSPASIYKRIIKWASRDHLSDRISLYSHLEWNELQRHLQTSDCVVIPSYSEGFCFAAAESIAMGVPVIASGKAALAEVVSGIYIFMEDMSADALIRALQKAESSEFVESPVKKFLLKDTVSNYMKIYEELSRD